MTAISARQEDFPDWMSPMLVKELRQGLRSKAFVNVFLIIQLVMIASVGIAFFSPAGDEGVRMETVVNVFFNFFTSPLLLLIVAIRAMGAINEEVQGKTLELVFLTRLTAFRIVWGKWAALNFQMLLWVCALLPYLVLRYFLGNVNLVEDLARLGLLLLGSAMLTAVVLGISPHRSRLLRMLFIPLMVIVGIQLIPMFFMLGMRGIGGLYGTTQIGWELYVMFLILTPLVVWFGLEVGASRIAPAAENHAFPKRLVGIAAVLLAFVFSVFGVPTFVTLTMAVLFLLFIGVDGMTERPAYLESLLRPFRRFGIPGKVAALFFLPGWASCGVYFILISAVMILAAWRMNLLTDAQTWTIAFSLPGIVLFPAALSQMIPSLKSRFLLTFVVVQGVSFLAFFYIGIVSMIRSSLPPLWAAWSPTFVFLFSLFRSGFPGGRNADIGGILPVTVLVLVLSAMVLLLIALPWFRAVFSRLQAKS